MAFLTEAYDEEVLDEEKNDKRIVMHFHPAIAPFKAAVLPLSKKLNEQAGEVYAMLSKNSTLIMMTPALSARDIAVRTKSVLLTA